MTTIMAAQTPNQPRRPMSSRLSRGEAADPGSGAVMSSLPSAAPVASDTVTMWSFRGVSSLAIANVVVVRQHVVANEQRKAIGIQALGILAEEEQSKQPLVTFGG